MSALHQIHELHTENNVTENQSVNSGTIDEELVSIREQIQCQRQQPSVQSLSTLNALEAVARSEPKQHLNLELFDHHLEAEDSP